MFLSLSLLSTAPVDVSLELAFLVGRGGRPTNEDSRPLASWSRIGPEVAVSVYPSPRWSFSLAAGYQFGLYDGSASFILPRSDLSADAFVRYHAATSGSLQHVFGLGLGLFSSHKLLDDSTYVIHPELRDGRTRLAFEAGYGPSVRVSDRVRFVPELRIAFWPIAGDSVDLPQYVEAVLLLGCEWKTPL